MQHPTDAEKMVHQSRRHWVVFAWPALLAALMLVLNGFNTRHLLLTFVVPVAYALYQYGTIVTSRYVVTSERVIIKTGLFKRQSLELLKNRIEGIFVEQSPVGRLLGYGTLVISGTGGMRQGFAAIGEPFAFRAAVQQLENARG